MRARGFEYDPMPQGALCGEHPGEPAVVLCRRCGSFACNACTRSEPPESLCSQCDARALPLADPAVRLLAHLVDVLAVSVPIATAILFGLRAQATGHATVLFSAGAATAFTTTAISLVGVHRTGQSIGKRLFGLQVVGSDSSTVGVGQVVWRRNVLPLLIAVIPLVGQLWILLDGLFVLSSNRQCLHDRLADTLVVRRVR